MRHYMDRFRFINPTTVEDLWTIALSCNTLTSCRRFLSFLFAFFQHHILIKLPDTLLPFGTAICTSGSEFLKKTACNTFFAVIVHLAILELLTCFRAHILLPTFRLGSWKWTHVSSPVMRLSVTLFWYLSTSLAVALLFAPSYVFANWWASRGPRKHLSS